MVAARASFTSVGRAARAAPTAAVLLLIRSYQILFSPLFAGACRFTPSCSNYAAEAVRRHGVLKGGSLAVRRLGRCHPLCEGGHDPVPGPEALKRSRSRPLGAQGS